MCQITKLYLFLEMPQTAGVVLNTLSSVRLKPVSLFVVAGSLLILNNFHISSSNCCKNPTGVEMLLRQFLELFNCLNTIVTVHVVTAIGKLFQQSC